MALLTIGDGKHVGDWDVTGNGRGGYEIRRLDPVKPRHPNAKEKMETKWTVVGEATNIGLAVEALRIVMQQDMWLMMGLVQRDGS